MFIVTYEGIDDGMWFDNPEGFATELQAEEYVIKRRARLQPGHCLSIYRCKLVNSYEPSPQESTSE